MSYKPDEATLAAYLYGELSIEEQERVDSYLKSNPEVKNELEEVNSVRKIMGKLEEKEVVTPSFVFEDSAAVVISGREGGFSTFIKSTMAIAASITLLILTGYFTKMNVSYQESGLQVSFGETAPETSDFNEENIKSWMQEAMALNNENLIQKINEVGDETRQLKEGAGKTQFVNNKPDKNLMDEYISQIKLENRDIILGLMDATTRDQKQYMDDLMTDFARFLETQRQSDLDLIEGAINQVANNVEDVAGDDYRTSEE